MAFLRECTPWFPLTFFASLVLYVILGANDKTWAGPALDTAIFSSLGMNLTAYVILIVTQQRQLLWINAGFTAIILLLLFFGSLDAFPGTGGRYGNHNGDLVAWLCLVNFFTLTFLWERNFLAAVCAFLITFFITATAANIFITEPLLHEIGTSDLSRVCFIRTRDPSQSIQDGARIRSLSEVKTGALIGESSPRFYKINDKEVRQWLYSSRKFSRPRPITEQPIACRSDQP